MTTMEALERRLVDADRAIAEAELVWNPKGGMPDEIGDTLGDAQTKAMHSILVTPAQTVADILTKIRVAMRVCYFEYGERPLVPEDAYALAAETLNIGDRVALTCIWADIERLAAKA